MKKILKRFVASVTGLRTNIFSWARFSITILYLLIILAVLAAYSFAVYFSLLKNIRMANNELIDHAIDNLQLKISIIDFGTFIIAAIGSYWLAGVTLRPIKRALEAQEAFSADASHELRTPLAVMKTDIEVLLRGKTALSPEVTRVFKSNLEEITLLSNMTAELLELSRGKQNAHEIVPLGSIAQEEVEKMQNVARQKNIALSFQAGGIGTVRGDRHALARVIKNIIANAISYTPTNGSVAVSVKEERGRISVSVIDTGSGIAPADLPHIFKRFYKADATRGASNGSGLGLAIAKKIVEQYRGTITVQSAVNKGSTVVVTLPTNLH
jgi:signal transduction histidine kinase